MIFQLKTKTKCHKDEECKDMAQMLKLLSCFLYIFLPLLCFLESTPSTPLLLPFLFCPFSACCWLNSALCSIFWGRTLVAGPSRRCPSAANSTLRGQGVQRWIPRKTRILRGSYGILDCGVFGRFTPLPRIYIYQLEPEGCNHGTKGPGS